MATRFEHRNIRSGTKIAGRAYTVRCSKCGHSHEFGVNQPTPDTEIKRDLRTTGWLIAKDRTHDLCPRCNLVLPEAQLAGKFKTTRDGQPVKAADQVLDERQAETAALLERHMPTPKTKPAQDSPMTMQTIRVETGLSLEQTMQLATALTTISTSLAQVSKQMSEVSASILLLAEESAMTRQAIAQIVPTLVRTNENLSRSIDLGFDRVLESLSTLSASRSDERTIADKVRDLAAEIMGQPVPSIDSTDELPVEICPTQPPPGNPADADLSSAETDTAGVEPVLEDSAPATLDAGVGLRSYRDSTIANPTFRRTEIRMARQFWDSMHFDESTRVTVERDGHRIRLIPGAKGVRAKKVTGTSVIFQTTKIGDAQHDLGTDLRLTRRRIGDTVELLIEPRTAA